MKVIGYVCSYRRNDMDYSLENKIQKEKIEKFCKKYGFELLNTFIEEKQNETKPSLKKLIDLTIKEKIDKIIILKFNLFSLNEEDKTYILEGFKKNNIEIYSLTESNPKNLPEPKSKAAIIKAKVRDIPSLPEVVTKVIELVQNPNSSASQLSDVIVHDPGLTSRVLRLVNSSYYGFQKQISDIQHAIMILGFTTIRGLVLSTSIFKIFSQKGKGIYMLDYKDFWKHSLVNAVASKAINNFLFYEQDQDIFSSAILHDIGKIILDQYDHDNYIEVLKDAQEQMYFNEVIEAEKTHCGTTHMEIGYLVAEEWNLPSTISEAILYHHKPLDAEDDYKKLACMVYLGNIFAYIVLGNKPLSIALFDNKVLDYLKIDEDNLYEIKSLVTEEVEKMGDLEKFFK